MAFGRHGLSIEEDDDYDMCGRAQLKACALFIIFLLFPIPELSVSSVDRPVPKNDGRGRGR
jgi:hypothetical protein